MGLIRGRLLKVGTDSDDGVRTCQTIRGPLVVNSAVSKMLLVTSFHKDVVGNSVMVYIDAAGRCIDLSLAVLTVLQEREYKLLQPINSVLASVSRN